MNERLPHVPLLATATLLCFAIGACGKAPPPAQPAPPKSPYPEGQEVALPEPGSPTVPSSPWQKVPDGLSAVAVTKADVLKIAKFAAAIPSEDPYGPWWQAIPYTDVPVQPQMVTMPTLQKASIESLRVQVAHDGSKLAVRIEWPDAVPDGNVDTGRFTDAVAVEFPQKADAPVTMGGHGAPVHILHWKAIWQKDIDVGYQDVQDLHPNFWSDLYWFSEGGHPHKIPDAFKNPESLKWLVAVQAGNPMAVLQRAAPVEELGAIGFGTLTHQPNSATTARGLWTGGKWAVVFVRPLKTADLADAQLTPGQATKLAFAVWDGGNQQVGGRKHWSAWSDVEVAP